MKNWDKSDWALAVTLSFIGCLVLFLWVMAVRQWRYEAELWADCKADGYKDYECYGILRRGR